MQDICAVLPTCCESQWDEACVDAVFTECDSMLCPESTPGCEHGLCEFGGPLTPECDVPPLKTSCVSAVCEVDAVCCLQPHGVWDGQCLAEAFEICGLSCEGG